MDVGLKQRRYLKWGVLICDVVGCLFVFRSWKQSPTNCICMCCICSSFLYSCLFRCLASASWFLIKIRSLVFCSNCRCHIMACNASVVALPGVVSLFLLTTDTRSLLRGSGGALIRKSYQGIAPPPGYPVHLVSFVLECCYWCLKEECFVTR